jgi:hypothetical protein
MDVPMLTDEEWACVWVAYEAGCKAHLDGRPAALAEYARITGYKETTFNALFDHIISRHGEPCPRCGKVLRTPIAYKCFECGLVVHKPNWAFLFQVATSAFVVKGRGTVIVADSEAVTGRVKAGDEIEIRDGGQRVTRTKIVEIGEMHGWLPGRQRVGFVLPPDVAKEQIQVGQVVWLVRPREENNPAGT